MRRKKLTVIVVVVVVVALILSIGGYLISDLGKSSSTKDIAKKVDSKKIVQETNVKKDKSGNKNEVVIKNDANANDVAKFTNDYLSKVVSDSNDKVVRVSFVQNNKQVQNAVVYKDLKSSSGNIKYSVRIQNGFLPINRFVEVIVDTANPLKNSVSAFGKNLKYNNEKKLFYGVVNSSDEQKIKDSIIVK